MLRLKRGQILYIGNVKYVVDNMVEYKEDTWNWQEYEIISDTNYHRWLSVEEVENGELEFWVYDVYGRFINTNDIEIYANNTVYELYEKGRAVVKDYFGNADVDIGETCNYYDYMSKDRKSIISVEIWDGEKEESIGTYLENNLVRITEEIDPNKSRTGGMSIKKASGCINAIMILFFGFMFVSCMFVGVSNSASSKSASKYLEKQTSKYTYVTSVTNNTNNKKAKVYKSSLSTVDATVKDIIDGIPEGITSTIDSDPSTEEDGIALQTSKEHVYIYKEQGDIYVQVSSKEYVERSGTMYHSRHHSYYYRSYTSNSSSSTYSSYASSARQNSINSRKSSGGGTSSGK